MRPLLPLVDSLARRDSLQEIDRHVAARAVYDIGIANRHRLNRCPESVDALGLSELVASGVIALFESASILRLLDLRRRGFSCGL